MAFLPNTITLISLGDTQISIAMRLSTYEHKIHLLDNLFVTKKDQFEIVNIVTTSLNIQNWNKKSFILFLEVILMKSFQNTKDQVVIQRLNNQLLSLQITLIENSKTNRYSSEFASDIDDKSAVSCNRKFHQQEFQHRFNRNRKFQNFADMAMDCIIRLDIHVRFRSLL